MRYVLLPFEMAKKMNLEDLRDNYEDGVLCYENDFSTFKGDYLFEKIKPLDGVELSDAEANKLANNAKLKDILNARTI